MSPADKPLCVEAALERDLPSVASRAALQLDNLLIGTSTPIEAVKELAESLARMRPSDPETVLDPTAAVVVNRAIDDAKLEAVPLSTIEDLLLVISRIQKKLEAVVSNPEGIRENRIELETLRGFCVSLSRSASGLDPSFEELDHRNLFL